MTIPGGASTTLRIACLKLTRARPTGFYHRVGALTQRGSGPLSQIETSVTSCGMVGLQAMALGRLGRKPSPHPRACALSCPSSAIYGPGSLGRFTRPFALHPLCVAQERLWCEYDYLRWGAHHTKYSYNSPMLGAPASIIGSELPPLPRYGAPVLHFPRAGVPNLERLALLTT